MQCSEISRVMCIKHMSRRLQSPDFGKTIIFRKLLKKNSGKSQQPKWKNYAGCANKLDHFCELITFSVNELVMCLMCHFVAKTVYNRLVAETHHVTDYKLIVNAVVNILCKCSCIIYDVIYVYKYGCFKLWRQNFNKNIKIRQESRTCYRKDDCAMRPLSLYIYIYTCPEKFRESLATPTSTFPEIVHGLLL